MGMWVQYASMLMPPFHPGWGHLSDQCSIG
jgi:hypothetical protein